MGEAASLLFNQGLAESTRKRYDSVWLKYSAWCDGLSVDPLPVTEEKATGYVVTLACGGCKAVTVKYHLAGLRQAHVKAGLEPPEWKRMARLAQIRRGMERWEVVHGPGKLERHPVRWCHMIAMRESWEGKTEKGPMLWAAACLCFFGCLRAGEALAPDQGAFDEKAHLTWKDVELCNGVDETVIRVKIKESKTDRLRVGEFVWLKSSGGAICPVKAMLEFMVIRKEGPGPFFMDGDKVGLTRKKFVLEVKGALERKGLASTGISGHSFRIGAATAAAAGGASGEEVKALGRWKSREYKGYIRRAGSEQAEASVKLTQAASTVGLK